MTVSNFVRIGGETVDISKPCDIHTALLKVQLRLASGGLQETVRIDGEEVTYQRANDRRLADLITHYRNLCPAARSQRGRTRYAMRPRYT